MTKLTFVEFNGTRHEVDVRDGFSVMQAAVMHNVPGLDADCLGDCACATCQVYVEETYLGLLPAPSELETKVLDFVMNPAPNSRLACQIKITPALEGVTLGLPEFQY